MYHNRPPCRNSNIISCITVEIPQPVLLKWITPQREVMERRTLYKSILLATLSAWTLADLTSRKIYHETFIILTVIVTKSYLCLLLFVPYSKYTQIYSIILIYNKQILPMTLVRHLIYPTLLEAISYYLLHS